jgi:hypothetical protein
MALISEENDEIEEIIKYDENTGIMTTDVIGKTECSRDVVTFQNMLQNKIDSIEGSKYQEKLDYLNKCNCCEKHKINRPNRFSPWIELPFHNDQTLTCACDCRHMARLICRQHPDY